MTTHTNLDLTVRMVQLGAHLTRLKPNMKQPSESGWTLAPAITPAEAETYVAAGGNLGVNQALSRLVVLDAENEAATAALLAAGFELTVIPAKAQYQGILKPGLSDPDSGKENRKYGGSHVWLRVPDGIDASTLPADRLGIELPGGGKVDALAGRRYVVAPPSALELVYGGRYAPAVGGLLDLDTPLREVPVAPMWLFDKTVPCPPGLEPLHGILAPKLTRDQVEQNARSAELSDQIDEVPWDQWLAADHRLTPTDEVDGCGCAVWHWLGAEHDKSVTLHDGCAMGSGAHVWSGTMIAELGLPGDHVSRLDLAVALRRKPRSTVAAAHGITLGERAELGVLRPINYENLAAHFEKLGETARAAMYREAAGNMAAAMPTPEQRGETFTSGQVLGALSPAPAIGAVPMEYVPVIDAVVSGLVPPAFGGPAAEVAYTRAPDPGPFPIDALPPVIRAHAEWVMDAKNVPGSMVGPMYLPMLSAGCNRATITPRTGWTEKGCSLWVAIIAPPSTRKSPVLAEVEAPLKAAQKVLRELHDANRRMCILDAEAVEEALDAARKEYTAAVKAARAAGAAAGNAGTAATTGVPSIGTVNGPTPAAAAVASDPDVAQLREQVEELEKEAREARARVPGRAVLSFDDATDAAMQDLMASCDGYGFMIAPEASGWFDDVVRDDSRNVTLQNYLKAYSAEAFKIFRVGRGEVWIDDPFLSMLHVIQPQPLRAALKPDRDGRNRLVGNGAWARYGVSFVEDVEPDEWDRPIPDGTAVCTAYEALIEREFVRSFGRETPLRFVVADDAQPFLGAIYNRIERIRHAQKDLPAGVGMVEEWGKACGRMLRIARVFRQIELTDEEVGNISLTHVIGQRHLRDAWRITEWMMASQAYAMGGAKADSDDDLVEKAVTWLRKRLAADGAVLYRKLRDNRTHRTHLDRALDQMVAAGEVTMEPGPRSNATVTRTEKLASAA
ncbi:DUF3987 domain-containing protein [Mycobacteroides abscessus]|nr:DUF3987 domain-containing protein [Mycobacteroides abscessus]MDO2981375.1 DUF3987 domain-containing protein [Mycobacteroides abscessus subsp. abscessus]